MTQDNQSIVADGSGQMFDQIAKRYDLLNRMISMGLDRGWRRRLVNAVGKNPQGEILDVATGTADVALDVARRYGEMKVTGLDPSTGMLEVGQQKVQSLDLQDRVELVEGDAQSMDFESNRFDASCISFGIRNVPDRALGLSEMNRVTKKGGAIVVLELSEPEGGLLAPFARFHVHVVVPTLGALISGSKEYRYLQKSVKAFPPATEFAEMMSAAGINDVEVQRLSFGAAYLYIGYAS